MKIDQKSERVNLVRRNAVLLTEVKTGASNWWWVICGGWRDTIGKQTKIAKKQDLSFEDYEGYDTMECAEYEQGHKLKVHYDLRLISQNVCLATVFIGSVSVKDGGIISGGIFQTCI